MDTMKLNILNKTLAYSFLFFFTSFAYAGQATDYLDKFVLNLKTMEGEFLQTLEDANGKQLQVQSGTLSLKKPGKFNWHYQTPFEQKIVSDGEKLWFYDIGLEQVTVKSLEDALGTAPIALLTTEQKLEEQFVLTDLGQIGEQYMVQLESKVKDTDYGHALLAFGKNGNIEVMQLKDPLGQVTTIMFDKLKMNELDNEKAFYFDIPDGVDVIGM